MRILHLIPSLAKGGAERICLDMVRALQREPDTDVRLVVLRNSNDYATEYPDVIPQCIEAHVIPSISGKWKVKLEQWDAILSNFRPDVIHSHLFEAEMVAHYYPVRGVRYVTHCHDNMKQLKRLRWTELTDKSRLTQTYERNWLLKKYSACESLFIVISSHSEYYFQHELPKSLARNVRLLPNAIDHSRFSTRSAVSPELGNAIKLVNIGSFVPNKNQNFLLKVAEELLKLSVDVRLSFAGSGPLMNDVAIEAQKLDIVDRISCLGNVDRVETLLWDSHVYVHSAFSEAFGLVLLEAMAAGLPVVTLDGHGNRELIENGVNGFMVGNNDPKVFAERILACFTPPDKWSTMSRAAKDFSKGFDIKAYVKKLLHFYTHGELPPPSTQVGFNDGAPEK